MRFLKNIGIVICCITIIITVVLVTMSVIFHQGLSAQLTKLKSSGKYSTLADFKTEKVPDDQNAATIYMQMIKETPKITPENSGKIDSIKLSQIVSDTRNNTNTNLWDEARIIINRNTRIYNQLNEATKRPYCVLPIDWSRPDSALLHDFSILSGDSCVFLCTKMLLDTRDGKPEYLNPFYTGVEIDQSFSKVPYITIHSFRYSNLRMICTCLVRSLEYRDVSESDIIRLRDTLSRIDLGEGLALSFKLSRLYFFLNSPNDVTIDYVYNLDRSSTGIKWVTSSMAESAYEKFYRSIGQYGDKATWLNYIDKQINSMDMSYKEFVDQGLADPQFPFYAAICHTRGFEKYQISRYITEECLSATQTILALHAYRNRYGSYPSSLDELRSKMGWEIPVDPFSSKDFVYKKDGKGFLLYSVGPDMKDDGGVIDYYKSANNKKKRGDIIWKLDR